MLRSHPGLVSAVGGLIFATLLALFGGAPVTTPADLVLPALIGLVFAMSMFAAARRRGNRLG
jgi:hypothetical protein